MGFLVITRSHEDVYGRNLVEIDPTSLPQLSKQLRDQKDSQKPEKNGIQNLKISIQKTSPFILETTIPQCEISLSGADNEGLVHKVAERLAEKGINIEEMETGTENAPMSGTILFIKKWYHHQ